MTGARQPAIALHATAVALGEYGLLISGASGAGKSRLAQALIAASQRRGDFARLVSDDRVLLSVTNGRVLARPHPAIAGLMEERGTGLLDVAFEPAVRVIGLVDLAPKSVSEAVKSRLPEPDEGVADVAGAPLPRLALLSSLEPDEAARRALAFFHRINH